MNLKGIFSTFSALYLATNLIGCSSTTDEGGSAQGSSSKAAFAQTLHPILNGAALCSGCHREDATTPFEPYLAEEDITKSFNNIASFVDLASPSQSRIVQYVLVDDHECWSGDCAADARVLGDALIVWSKTNDSGVSDEKDASFMAGFGNTLWPSLQANCSNCHDGLQDNAPAFASDELDKSYYELVDKNNVSFETPANSRIVRQMRLTPPHNCGEPEACEALASGFERQIQSWYQTVATYGTTASKSAFSTSLHNYLRGEESGCADCHDGTPNPDGSPGPMPFAAESIDLSYKTVVEGKFYGGIINFENAAQSFIIEMMTTPPGHNCGNAEECANIATTIESGIKSWLASDDIVGDLRNNPDE